MFDLDSSSSFILSWILELQRKILNVIALDTLRSSLRRKMMKIFFRGKSKERPFSGIQDLDGLRFAALKQSWTISSLERRGKIIVLILAIVLQNTYINIKGIDNEK